MMMYAVDVDFAPAYELLTSLYMFIQTPLRRGSELGAGWHEAVRSKLTPAFAGELIADTMGELAHSMGGKIGLELLIRQCPEERTPDSFLNWLAGLSAGEVFERIAPWVDPIPPDLGARRDYLVHVLRQWNDQYFRHIDSAILTALAADAAVKCRLAATMSPVDLVEHATIGIVHNPTDRLERVVLVPSYHLRPLAVAIHHRGLLITSFYPVDGLPTAQGVPPASLLRLTRCLSDESRLRILHHLGTGRRTFGELVKLSGLTKGTVTHHLIALRWAGLIRVHGTGTNVDGYTLRESAVADLGPALLGYLRNK